jgi:hypothetical protein
MISFCSAVINTNLQDHIDIITDTLCRHTKWVKEVIFVQTDLRKDKLVKSWSKNGIEFRHYGLKPFDPPCPLELNWEKMICGHASGLHQAIGYAQQEYVWMSDPDVFLLSSVDETYLNLIKKYDLNVIGVSHFNSDGQSYLYFPCVINCMMKRANLPHSNWLGGFHAQTGMRIDQNGQKVFSVRDCWTIPGPLQEYYESFPNPSGIFDAGCNLWLWNEQNKGRWLSFYLDQEEMADKSYSYHLSKFKTDNIGFSELVYPLNYSTSKYKTNFGLKDDLGNTDLIYHRTKGSQGKIDSYKRLYESLYQSCP